MIALRCFKKGVVVKIALVVVIVSLFAVVLFVAGNKAKNPEVYSKADYPAFSTLPELVEHTQTIVAGNIIGKPQRKEIDIGDGDIYIDTYYVYEFKISEVLKGKVNEGEQIEIKIQKRNQDNKALLRLKMDKEYVLFIETYPDSPASLINPYQGQLLIDKQGFIVADVQNSIFNPEQKITLDELLKEIANIE